MTVSSRRRVEVGDGFGFDVWTHRAGTGPRVVVLGGVHGDETEGVLAAGMLAAGVLDLTRGTVDIVPICHEAAYSQDSRTSPIDNGNLARVFPGSLVGGATERVAHHLFVEVLSGCDLLIDLHTSGRSYTMPVLAGYRGAAIDSMSLARSAAEAFGGDFLWRHPAPSEGRTVSVVDQGIYVESPGGGATDTDRVEHYVAGVRRVLHMMEMAAYAPPFVDEPIRVVGGGNLDRDMVAVTHPGLFLHEVGAGDFVSVGQRLGVVVDPTGVRQEDVVAQRAGHVMALKTRSSVTRGDLVVCVAAVDV